MTVSDYVRSIRDRYRTGGVRAAGRKAAKEGALGLSRRAGCLYGEDLFKRDWDVAIVLDACRHDALVEVAPEYDWLPSDIGMIYSCASETPQWLDAVVAPENEDVLGETTYVSSNPQTTRHGRGDLLGDLIQTTISAERGVTEADVRRVTEAAIQAGREHSNERLLVHYLPPHFPSAADPVRCERHNSPHRCVQSGELSVARLWESYLANLRLALDEVGVLRRNFDAGRAVITADHGELFGEYGGLHRHPPLPLPLLRRVPWVEVGMSDERTLVPDRRLAEFETDASSETVDERLRSLGYV